MSVTVEKLAKYRQIMGIGVAALILTIIFVPFQTASAFTVTLDLPESDDDTITQSASGEPFEITIDVEAGELISVSSIELILDNNESSVKRTIFGSDGDRTSGSTNLVIGNSLEIDSSSSLNDYGYAYGYGLVSPGTTFNPNYAYSYSFSYSYAFIGGNTGGYANAGVTEFVAGIIGPGTITISGNLKTASLAEGTHTLDVLINTGAGGDGEEELVAPQLSFEVEEAEDLVDVEEEVTAGATDAEITVPGFEVDGEPATITLNFGVATTTTGNAVVTLQTPASFITSKTPAQLAALDLEDDGSGNLVVDNDFTIAGVISDIDLSALGLPDGTDITIGLSYDDSSLDSDEEASLRLFHFNDDTGNWETLTNDDATVNGGNAVDATNNIVYGTTDDFSLFAPAFSPSTGGGGGEDGVRLGLGGGQTVYVGILPESFLADNPLLRIQISSHAILNSVGERMTSVRSGEQVEVNTSFKNYQGHSQDYALIVQIIDEDGITTDIGWVTGNADSEETVEGSRSWLATDPGNYSIRIFVWNNVDESPIPLSEMATSSFSVTT